MQADNQETPVLPASQTEFLKNLFDSYSNSIKEAETATEQAIAKVEQNMTTLRGNKIALAAQKQVLQALEKDLKKLPA
jgi:hypothetical protein